MALTLSSEATNAGRRSAFEVMMDILKATAEGPTKPTHIMYRSNTSWINLQKNLQTLISSGFLRQSEDGVRTEYAITDRGLAVVRDYDNLVVRVAKPTGVEF
jgi:predicted transcriptional regulator